MAARKKERGSAFIEFLFTSLIWLPLLLGTIVFGINLVRAIQVSQLARDSGHMYAYGIDFSLPQNLPMLQQLAGSLNIQQKSGDGAIVLSKVALLTQAECDAAKVSCTNVNQYVFTSLITFGNEQYANTRFGNPPRAAYNADLTKNYQYMTDPTLVATGFPLLYPQPYQMAEYASVSEVTVNTQAVNWSSFTNTGSYARSIF